MREYIQKLVAGKDLTSGEAEDAMRRIMSGEATQAQIGSFLTAMSLKGGSASEIASFARVMREFAHRIEPKVRGRLVDMCGTGGDAIKTFNISTIASFVVAGAGVPVAKHGNRSVTSKSGSADLLEALGAKIDMPPEKVRANIEEIGFGFMFAPLFHSAMKHAIGPRKEIGIRTVFNVLGPLTNPASAKAQVMGVYDEELLPLIAKVLSDLGVEKALVVHGVGGLDEVSTIGPTRICEVTDGKLEIYSIHPSDFRIREVKVIDLQGGDPYSNCLITRDILQEKKKGPKRDVVLLNAACGIYVGGKAGSIEDALELASESIDSGRAFEIMNAYLKSSRLAEAYA
ncbi:anthranilate phosphoribosyltransferase [Methanocella sp. CWC-04]|uniref:Anthranilate phosphoribosyltransferase n=1 Tax=Methanooceanicella nereidis TaxID=2052831 RepID=A0AAP2RHI4_9EURY|nr:anthranilate phosphoribosyltransferase [Methanocella sp. CWC-04]MCD1296342.1 anthranilate phosphoribosyltransferase [Methanocella sp. CWC-04]